jgi:hypothetical protein
MEIKKLMNETSTATLAAFAAANSPMFEELIKKAVEKDKKLTFLISGFPSEIQKEIRRGKGKVYKDPFTNEVVWWSTYGTQTK